MAEIKITDVSLRESEQVYAARLSFKEKLETAKLLEKLMVDVIETSGVGDAPADSAFIRTLASTLEYSTVSVPVTLDRQSADRAWEALAKAKKPRLNVVAPASTVQMEYKYQLKAETLLPLVSDITAYCAGLCPDVEFTAVDATRSEPGFLAELLCAAIDGGAKTVTLCDSTGELLPEEFAAFVSKVYEAVPKLRDVTLSLHCFDNLGLASAAALAGVEAGARQIKVSSGVSSRTLPLEQFLNIIKIRGETLGISYNINATALQRTAAQLSVLSGGGVSGNFAQDGAELKKEDSALPENINIDELRDFITGLGYDISDDDLEKIFEQVKEISRSKTVVDRDIEALIAETSGQASSTYQLCNYVINSGSAITATAFLEISENGAKKTSLSAGDGPIDAAFKAAEQILGIRCELEEFQIQAVTGGFEAIGDAIVKLRSGGKLYSGRGVSTDIISASIRAYLSAANKIVFEEHNRR